MIAHVEDLKIQNYDRGCGGLDLEIDANRPHGVLDRPWLIGFTENREDFSDPKINGGETLGL